MQVLYSQASGTLGSPATSFLEKSGSSLLLTYMVPMEETQLLVHFLR